MNLDLPLDALRRKLAVPSLPRFAPRRQFVAVVGNEGIVVSRISGRRVVAQRYVPTPDPDGAAALVSFLRQDRRAPVSILVDVLEQHYRETTIPQVRVMDRGKLLKRKLEQSYGGDHLTTYVPLPRGEASEPHERRYLLIGVPYANEIKAWLDVVVRAGNPVRGMSLLPVEAVELVRQLRPKPPGAPSRKAAWQVLITRQRASGFRQVIVHDGRLVFTRLTPNPEPDTPVAEIVDGIESEFRSTVSYLRRLSFSDADHLELTIVAEPAVCEQIVPRRMQIHEARLLSPGDAARALGVEAPAEADSPFCESLIAAWFARQPRPQLRIDAPNLLRLRLIGLAPRLAYAGALAVLAAGGVYGGGLYLDLREQQELQSRIAVEEGRLTRAMRDLEQQMAALSIAPDRFAMVLKAHDALSRSAPLYAPVIAALADTLPADMTVSFLRLDPGGEGLPTGQQSARILAALAEAANKRASARGQPPAPPRAAAGAVSATVHLADPPAGRDAIMQRYDRLAEALRGRLPGYSVVIERGPLGADASGRLIGSVGVTREGGERPPRVVEGVFRIEGPSS